MDGGLQETNKTADEYTAECRSEAIVAASGRSSGHQPVSSTGSTVTGEGEAGDGGVKVCRGCGVVFTLEYFHKYRKAKDGHASLCKICANRKTREWVATNPERKKDGDRVYRLLNKERLDRGRAERKRKNRDRENAITRIRYAANLDRSRVKNREKMRLWRADNHDQEVATRTLWNECNPGERARRLRVWRQANPEKARAEVARYRSRKRGATESTLTAVQWLFIKDLYSHRCVYCGRKMQRLTQDHIIPLSKGGMHTMDNIVSACQSCNSKKKDGPPLIPVQPLLPLGL